MKKIIVSIIALGLVVGFSASLVAKRSTHTNVHQATNRCKELEKQGIECKISSWVGCGAGWKKDKAFRGAGKDYFSCVKTMTHKSYERNSKHHKHECEKFCKRNPDCKECKEGNVCGAGYKVGKKFDGAGRNWVACFQTSYGEESDDNKARCERWCHSHKCAKCSKVPTCGPHYRAAKTFGGKGKNWYACFKDITR